MATTISITGTVIRTLTTGDEGVVSRVRFQVTGASSLAMDVQGAMKPSPGADPAFVDMAYTNVASNAAVSVSTDITADGIYEVDSGGLIIALLPTAGKAQITYLTLLG